MDSNNEKFKWRKWDYYWLIGILIFIIILVCSIRLSDNRDISNIISLISSIVSIVLALISIWWSQVNNSDANRVYDKIIEKLDIVVNETAEINKKYVIKKDETNPGKFIGMKLIQTAASKNDFLMKHNDVELCFKEIKEKLDYLISEKDEEFEELKFYFNRGLTEEEYEKFVELFSESSIPLSEGEMIDGFSGIVIGLDEAISGYEKYKAREEIREILKKINPRLNLE